MVEFFPGGRRGKAGILGGGGKKTQTFSSRADLRLEQFLTRLALLAGFEMFQLLRSQFAIQRRPQFSISEMIFHRPSSCTSVR